MALGKVKIQQNVTQNQSLQIRRPKLLMISMYGTAVHSVNLAKTLKIGTLRYKKGPNRDPRIQKVLYRALVPKIGTLFTTVHLWFLGPF